MGIFARYNDYNYGYDSRMESYGIEDGAAIAHLEAFDDMLAIVEAMHEADMAEIEAKKKEAEADSDEEIGEIKESLERVLEGAFSNIWAKIKEYLNKLWAKLKSFFHAARRFFDGLVMSATDFVKKYKKELNDLDSSGKLRGFKYEMFKYTDISSVGDKIKKKYEEVLNDKSFQLSAISTHSDVGTLNAAKDGWVEGNDGDKIRAKFLGESGEVTATEFTTKINEKLRGGDEKDEVDIRITEIIKTIEDSKDLLKNVDDMNKASEKSFKEAIKEADRAAKTAETDKGELASARASTFKAYSSYLSTVSSVSTSAFKIWRSVATEQVNACMKVCRAAFGYKRKDD